MHTAVRRRTNCIYLLGSYFARGVFVNLESLSLFSDCEKFGEYEMGFSTEYVMS